jgi:hypothetical protein
MYNTATVLFDAATRSQAATPLCTVCHKNAVDAYNGYDTCADCIARM